ncbi:MAG: DEAD/DEAH box helicase [Elusimicrobiota bacterium]
MKEQEIFDFVDNKVIYQRGLDYYQQGCVADFEKKDNRITAEVRGTSWDPYRVGIQLGENDEAVNAWCNCPYSGDGVEICKHIAAALIYHQNENKALENPIIVKRRSFDQDKIVKLTPANQYQSAKFNFQDYLQQFVLKKIDDRDEEKHCLVFVIQEIKTDPAGQGSYLAIYPELRYFRTEGGPARFSKFDGNKTIEPCSESEKALLYKLKDKGKKEDFFNHIDFLLENNCSLYYKSGSSYLTVKFEEIKKLQISFKLYRQSLNEIFFYPVIEILGTEQETFVRMDENCLLNSKGLTVTIIRNDGKIFYKRTSEFYYALSQVLRRQKEGFTYTAILKLKEFFQENCPSEINILFEAKSIRMIYPVPKPLIEVDYNGVVKMFFVYQGEEALRESPNTLIALGQGKNEFIVAKRHQVYEDMVYEYFVKRYKSIWSRQRHFNRDLLLLEMKIPEFLARYGPGIMKEGIEIRLKGRKNKISGVGGKIFVSVGSGVDWFDLSVRYLNSEGKESRINLDLPAIQQGLLGIGDSYAIVKKEDIEKLRRLLAEGMNTKGELRVSKYNFRLIDLLYQDIRDNSNSEIETSRMIGRQLKKFDKIENYPLSKNFKGKLRHYQQAGYNWLNFLNQYKINGCLADDMGLGKTVQTLAFLQKLKEENRLNIALIVVPVTTISNWEIEIKKFTPNLKYLLYYGQDRRKDLEHLKKYDLIVLSYHTLRNDIELFARNTYGYIILDEAQNIKNSHSLTFKAIRALKAGHRLSLTGTPLENNTMELWSQMDFLNPGLLGTLNDFKKKFTKPIEIYRDKEATENLKKMIFPFILRRKKETVLKDLPSKSEIILYSEMEEAQQKVYQHYRQYFQERIAGKIEQDGIEKSAIAIFTALLKLRQLALFPRLADKKLQVVPSCKFENLKNLIEEILEEDHKILVFSQFIEPLKIIEKFILEKKFNYCYIDGSSSPQQRKTEIKKFQEKPEIKLFLLSLKAGGIGINLTAADYVILFDPWWNPAVETQAIDRTHRIGQTRKVIAYKMIVKNTVEEKILELQEKKKNLVQEIITTESKFFKSLSKADIIDLFK